MKAQSAKEIAAKLGCDEAATRGFIALLVAKGILVNAGERKIQGAKGKPTQLFAVPDEPGVETLWNALFDSLIADGEAVADAS